MTDMKKEQAGKMAVKARKLQLNKETLKDLGAGKTAQVKGEHPKPATGGAPIASAVAATERAKRAFGNVLSFELSAGNNFLPSHGGFRRLDSASEVEGGSM